MTSRQHQHWLDEGSPWYLATPIFELKTAIERTWNPPAESIGTLGNDEHLDAEPPEDHTPYSETGWPIPTPAFAVTAIDYDGPGWEALFEHLIAERQAGRMLWIKYINFRGTHYRWEPDYQTSATGDWPGHGHLSIRSDWCHSHTNLSDAELTGAGGGAGGVVVTSSGGGNSVEEKIMSSWPTISQGATGQHVRDVQALLNAHGASLAVDGVDGPLTTAAVQQFQASHHVPNSVRADGTGDGQVGPQTLIALLDM